MTRRSREPPEPSFANTLWRSIWALQTENWEVGCKSQWGRPTGWRLASMAAWEPCIALALLVN